MTKLPKTRKNSTNAQALPSFKEMLALAQKESGDSIALKYKEHSSLHDITYTELCTRVNALGTALASMDKGLERVAVIGENSHKWITVYLTVLGSNGVFIPVDKELPFTEMVNILNHSDCTTVFFDRTFADSFKEYKSSLSTVQNYVCFKQKGSEKDAAGQLSYEKLLEEGQQLLAEGNEDYLTLEPQDDENRILDYKSGSADGLRGVMLSQNAIKSAVAGLLKLNAPGKKCLSVLHYDKAIELICGLLASFYCRSTVCIGDSLRSFQKNLKEYAPDYVFLAPLYLENIHRKLLSVIAEQGRAETMEKLIKTSNAMRRVGIDKRKDFFYSIHELMGGKLQTVYACGAAISPETVRFFDDIGITVSGCYGMTECSSLISVNKKKAGDFASAGQILPGVEVKIASPNEEGEGEICVRGDVVMMGYYKDLVATKEQIEISGWLHTGDLGRISDAGELYITGKIKREIVFKSGRTVAPEEMEGYLLTIPCVKNATVYAETGADGAEMLLAADIVLKEEQEGLTKEEKIALVKEKINGLNHTLPFYKKISKVRIHKN